MALRPGPGLWPLLMGLGDHTHWTHKTRQDSSVRVISPMQTPLPHNTQYLQETNIHATGGIQTHISRKRAATNPRLRPRSHLDRKFQLRTNIFLPRVPSFIHSVFCLTTGPKPPPKRFLHIVRYRASSFK